MNRPTKLPAYNPNRLLDTLIHYLGLNGDGELARRLGVAATIIHHIRSGRIAVGASILMWMEEASGIGIDELRYLLGDRRARCRVSVR